MKPNIVEISNLLNGIAKSVNFWRRFALNTEAGKLYKIISNLSPLELAALDIQVRGHVEFSYYRANDWRNLSPADVSILAKSDFVTTLAGVASFHGNGLVREAAIEVLAAQNSGEELTFLLIRLNDWVAEVRAAAVRAVRERVKPDNAAHILANAGLISKLRSGGRINKQFLDDVLDLLKSPECRDILRSGMTANDKMIRRMSFQLVAESDPSTRAPIVLTLMTDPDAITRLWAVRLFLPEVKPEELTNVIAPMLRDKYMPIRREALWCVASKRPDLAAEPLRAALLDYHASMRELAYQFPAAAGVDDIRQFFVEAIDRCTGSELVAAIHGLGEKGQATDVSRLLPFLANPKARLRCAAIYAVGKLDAEKHLSKLTEFLTDKKPSVSRAAGRILLRHARSIPLEELEGMFASGGTFSMRRNIFNLILKTGKWLKLPAILDACADLDVKMVKYATKVLRAWLIDYNKSFAEPTSADIEKIEAALQKAENALPFGAAKEIRACLKIYQK